VSIPSQRTAPSVLIPSSSVIQQGDLDAVIKIDSHGRAAVRYVTLGGTIKGLTEILTGVRPGDRVLTDGNLSFAGKKVEVNP
jgi:multidrug efflux pump subunit AcrA (membrane-fusion protein)